MSQPLSEMGGQVTVADLFRVMSEIRTDLGKAVTKLEVIDARNVNADHLHEDHEKRIRKLEAGYARAVGFASAFGVIAGALAGWLSGHVH